MPKAYDYLVGPLQYLIGTDTAPTSGGIVECGYDSSFGTIAYCNLFDEKNSGKYGPYIHNSDTAAQYNEGQIDPSGPGWGGNLRDQFTRRRRQGFQYVELDNPDAYKWEAVYSAIQMAQEFGLKVIAKNPGITDNPLAYISHPNIYGIIVEKDAGDVHSMHNLRVNAGKPTIPVWFVSFGSGRHWADSILKTLKSAGYTNMYVSYSSVGEYGNSIAKSNLI